MRQRIRGFELKKEVVRQAAVQQATHEALVKDLSMLHDAINQTRSFMADLSQRLDRLEQQIKATV